MASRREEEGSEGVRSRGGQKRAIVWDMETADPDDAITLMFLAAHPEVELKAVTVTPGSPAQVGVVRWVLEQILDKEDAARIEIGAGPALSLPEKRGTVGGWHYKALSGTIAPSTDAKPAAEVLLRCCDADTTLVTGAPVRNLHAAIVDLEEQSGARPWMLGTWVAQGGFAGKDVVPDGVRWPKNLDKFRESVVCPTFNFSGDHEGARIAVDTPLIRMRRLVGKNVCHRNTYTPREHRVLGEALRVLEEEQKAQRGKERPEEARMHRALALIHRSLGVYIDGKGLKKLHDPLAAVAALDPTVCTWEEVRVVQEGKTKWGCVKEEGTNTFAAVDFDPVKFIMHFTYHILKLEDVREMMKSKETEEDDAEEPEEQEELLNE